MPTTTLLQAPFLIESIAIGYRPSPVFSFTSWQTKVDGGLLDRFASSSIPPGTHRARDD